MTTLEVVLRLMLAITVGGLIGYERGHKNRPAGFRTHILVCVGAAVTSMIQIYSIEETVRLISMYPGLENSLKADIGRLGAQVITGVGFLGAGTIMHEKGSVKGLTTAASLWSVACIGLAVGLGYYSLALISTFTVFIVLVILKKFETRFIDRTKIVKLDIQWQSSSNAVQRLTKYFEEHNIKVKNIEFALEEEDEEYSVCIYTLIVQRELNIDVLVEAVKKDNDIFDVKLI
jgi:putative Mg2+ transporter-C (MgtC) family protein